MSMVMGVSSTTISPRSFLTVHFSSALIFCSLVLLLASTPAHAQMIREWLHTGAGGFTGSYCRNNLAAADSRHFVCAESGSLLTIKALISDDGGLSWQTLLELNRFNGGGSPEPFEETWGDLNFTAVSRPTPDLIFLAGSRTAHGYSDWVPFVLRSTDRGTQWTNLTLTDSLTPFHPTDIVMQNASHGAITGTRHVEGGDPVLALRVTTDGGDSWSESDLPFQYYVGDILFEHDGGILVTSMSDLYRSTDLGGSWSHVCELPDGARVICRAGASTLILGANKATGLGDLKFDMIYRSTDGGTSWEKLYEGGIYPNFGINGIDFCDANNGIATGQWDRILRTTDGGYTWTRDVEPYDLNDASMGEVCFPSLGRAVCVTMTSIVTMTGELTPMPPILTVEQGSSPMQREAHWTDIEGADSYHLQLAEDKKTNWNKTGIFDTPQLKREWTLTDTVQALDAELVANKDYYIRVRAFVGSDTSDWSYSKKFETPKDNSGNILARAVLLRPTNGVQNINPTVEFAWRSVTGATQYNLHIATTPMFLDTAGLSRYGLTDTLLTIQLEQGKTYYWAVTATAEGKTSSTTGYRHFSTSPLTEINETGTPTSMNLTILPQPARDFIRVSFPAHEITSHCEIRDILGRTVLSPSMQEVGSGRIATHALTTGQYFLVVQARGATSIGRFVIQR